MLAHRVDHVLAARWMKPTLPAHDVAERAAVDPHKADDRGRCEAANESARKIQTKSPNVESLVRDMR